MLLGISFVLFMLLYIRPGSAAFAAIGSVGDADPRAFEKFEERFGLDRPWWEQYGDWLWGALQGDLGEREARALAGVDEVAREGELGAAPVRRAVHGRRACRQ